VHAGGDTGLLLEEAKFRPPAFWPSTVPREHALDRMRPAASLPVLSVTAPAGYGKSALLSQWSDRTPHRVAWVSLEREDNDLATLLAYLAAALDRVEPVDPDAFRTAAPPGTSVAAVVARRIAAALAGMSEPVALVLDHTELVRNARCRDVVAELAVHLPDGAQLVVASRGAPPVPLPSLRARGAVAEVGVDDLAMDEGEARLLLAGAGVELDDDAVADLVRRTEGWPVGLHLAALALRSGNRHRPPVAAFTGDDRLMADYLRHELLDHLPGPRVTFLTRTSVLDRMSGPLCDALLGTTRSGRLLETLDDAHLLLVALDRTRGWYRYHKLFQELLRAELDQREHENVARLHARAAAWCEANGLPEMAIEHAQAAGDADLAARLAARSMLATYAAGRAETAVRWVQWFDDRGLVERYPAIAVLGGTLLGILGQAAAAERFALAAERADGDEILPDGSPLASWRALLRAWTGRRGAAAMRRDAEEASLGLAPGSRWRPVAIALEGAACLAGGDLDGADNRLAEAAGAALDIGAWPAASVALAERALVAVRRGEWPEAAAASAHAVEVVEAGRLQEYGPAALVYAVAARVALHAGDPAGARRSLTRAARLRPQLTYAFPFLSVQTLVELARSYLALTDAAGARVVLREVRQILRLRPDLGALPREAEELQATLDLLDAGPAGASSLTAAELRVVPLLSTHLSFKEIGDRLHISRNTVKTHAGAIYRKLGVGSRSEAIERVEALRLLG
jgi:LuxR family maltose regulon positive regulatory protein